MAKVIRTVIDEQGNITSDLSGFVGSECVAEEERFRQDLAQYGLVLRAQGTKRKDPENEARVTVHHKVR